MSSELESPSPLYSLPACVSSPVPASPHSFPDPLPGSFWSLCNKIHIPGGKGLPKAMGTPLHPALVSS